MNLTYSYRKNIIIINFCLLKTELIELTYVIFIPFKFDGIVERFRETACLLFPSY